MAKRRRSLTGSIKKQKAANRTAYPLMKFKGPNTVVTPGNLVGNRTMTTRERTEAFEIKYVMTKHALERINERALHEDDIRSALTHGASFKQFQKETQKDVFVYEHKCFRVVADREVGLDTNEVVVITAMYSEEFNNLVRRFENVFYTSEWRLFRGLRFAYDRLGGAVFNESNTNRVKHVMIENGYVLHNPFTLGIMSLISNGTARGILGEAYDDFVLTSSILSDTYTRNWETASSGYFGYFCYEIGRESVLVKCHDWNYIVSLEQLDEWGLTMSEFCTLMYEVRKGLYATEGVHSYARSYRYSVTFCHCGGLTFVYDIQENPEYLALFTLHARDVGTNLLSRKYFKTVFDDYVAEDGLRIYDEKYFDEHYIELRAKWKKRKKKLVERGITF